MPHDLLTVVPEIQLPKGFGERESNFGFKSIKKTFWRTWAKTLEYWWKAIRKTQIYFTK